ncbi:MAG: 5-formyltetrahydrofolate cyclo-ligase, partial [Myxococcales bacterium]|nr:5-formyltetrahydrofolate cyclo-ligase [Myxococcales bacterium]
MISGERQLRERAKEEIRRKLTAVRRTIPAPQRLERSQKIVDRIDGLAEWMGAQCVGAYSPIRGEVDMEPLFTRARAQGKRIALPRTDFDQGT